MKTVQNIIDQIENLTSSELVALNNLYCQSCNMYDSEVYANDEEFFQVFYPNAGDGLKVAQAVTFGNYNYNDDWVRFNGYGNLETIYDFSTEDLVDLVSVIAEYVLEHTEEFEDVLDLD